MKTEVATRFWSKGKMTKDGSILKVSGSGMNVIAEVTVRFWN